MLAERGLGDVERTGRAGKPAKVQNSQETSNMFVFDQAQSFGQALAKYNIKYFNIVFLYNAAPLYDQII